MPKKIHYKDPATNKQACGLANDLSDFTPVKEFTTCRICQGWLKKWRGFDWFLPQPETNPVGRPSSPGGRHKISVVITDVAYNNFQAIPLGNRSPTVSNFLEGLDQPVGDKNVVGSGSGKDSV